MSVREGLGGHVNLVACLALPKPMFGDFFAPFMPKPAQGLRWKL